jgi:hypothetical protein
MAAGSLATRLRERLRGGPPLVGTFVKLPALESVDLVRSLGFDLAVVDGEHSQLDEGAILSLLRHGAALDLPMLVRTSTRDAGSLNRMIEAGRCRHPAFDPARVRPSAMRSYPRRATRPMGRGASAWRTRPPTTAGSRSRSTSSAARSSRSSSDRSRPPARSTRSPRSCVASTPRSFGTTDLSVDLGRPGMLDDARVTGRVSEIATAASSAGVALGAWVASADALAKLGDARFRYVLVGSDLQALRAGLSMVASAARKALS